MQPSKGLHNQVVKIVVPYCTVYSVCMMYIKLQRKEALYIFLTNDYAVGVNILHTILGDLYFSNDQKDLLKVLKSESLVTSLTCKISKKQMKHVFYVHKVQQ